MKVSIIKKQVLKDLPSASGIEIVNGIIYIIGDDSPFLYCLDHNLQLIQKVELFSTENFVTGRIPKNLKPDLECMTNLVINNNHYLLIIGSGANDKRELAFLVKLPTKYNKKYIVKELSFSNLFKLLRSNDDIVANGGLNLEGAASTETKLILFNRKNNTAPNAALVFNMEEFQVYLTENPDLLPFPEVISYELPSIKGIEAGFSGASTFNDHLFFTASLENAPDAIQDGTVYGSYVGVIGIESEGFSKNKSFFSLAKKYDSTFVLENGVPFEEKIESIAIYEQENQQQYIALAVTDDDRGGSMLLMLQIEINEHE